MNGESEQGILALFESCFGHARSSEEWRWLYPGNPVRPGVASLVVDPQGRVIGHIGGLPCRLALGGDRLEAVQRVDTMVAEPYRKASSRTSVLDVLIRHFDEAGGFELAFCFPRQDVARLAERLFGYRRIGNLAYHSRRPRRFARPSGGVLRPVDRLDARVDTLWQRCAPSLGIAIVRDQPYLSWRYGDTPRSYQSFEWIDRLTGELLGWAVVRADGADWEVVDMLALAPWESGLLRALERAAAKAGASRLRLRTLSESPLARRLMDQEYRYEATDLVLLARAYSPHLDSRSLSDDWYVLAGDSDRV